MLGGRRIRLVQDGPRTDSYEGNEILGSVYGEESLDEEGKRTLERRKCMVQDIKTIL